MMEIGRIRRYPGNPRRNADAVPLVARSIEEFGFRQPLVLDEELVIIVGDTRYLAAVDLGYTEVPVHVARGLSPQQVRAYRLADNRTGEEASWDDSRLLEEVTALLEASYDSAVTGFTQVELSALADRVAAELEPERDLNELPDMPAVALSKPGDVYQLGAHRLAVGDSTEVGVWDRLFLPGEEIELVWTDPPYAVNYEGKTARKLKIQNDGKDPAAIRDLLRSALALCLTRCRAGASWYVAAPHGPAFLAFAEVLTELEVWRQTLVWVKDVFALGHSDYHYRHEAIFYGASGVPLVESEQSPAPSPVPVAEDGAAALEREFDAVMYGWAPGTHQWYGGRKRSTVIEVPKPKANRDHPTMKPIELIADALQVSSLRGSIVCDPFGGSGSTLIACDQMGRVARVIEKDPVYADVIVRRWELKTGERAVRLNGDG